jgi:type IV secretion system protein VirB6
MSSLCLIFDQTKSLFSRWLMYGLGTIFSMALLSVVASMMLDLTIAVNEAIWGAKTANKLLGTNAEGLSTLALQQGGIGLLLTTLIISVPPMAAMFFQGTLGSFSPYSVFSGGAQRPGPQGQPPGSWGGGSSPDLAISNGSTSSRGSSAGLANRTPSTPYVAQPDVTKR